MHKKLTITVDEAVYDGLHKVVGRRRISNFIETLVRPHVLPDEVEAGFRALGAYERETGEDVEALEWIDGLIEDVADDPR